MLAVAAAKDVHPVLVEGGGVRAAAGGHYCAGGEAGFGETEGGGVEEVEVVVVERGPVAAAENEETAVGESGACHCSERGRDNARGDGLDGGERLGVENVEVVKACIVVGAAKDVD